MKQRTNKANQEQPKPNAEAEQSKVDKPQTGENQNQEAEQPKANQEQPKPNAEAEQSKVDKPQTGENQNQEAEQPKANQEQPKPNAEAEQKSSGKTSKTGEITPEIDALLKLYPQYEKVYITPKGFVHPGNAPAVEGATLYVNKYFNK